jgi:ABC-2 type transport system permease protein
MHRFKAFVKKEFYHILRDWRTLIILIGMPVAQILLFGFAITNEIKDAKIAVLDLSKDEITKGIVSRITASNYFKIEAHLDHNRQIEEIFKRGRVKEVIVFEENFAKKLIKDSHAGIQVISDATDPNTATLLLNYTKAIIGSQQLELNKSKRIPYEIIVEQKMLYNPELKGVYLFVPGLIAVILMLVSAMMTSISITKEKEMGTMEILLTTPMHPAQIIIAKVIPYLLLSFINAVLVLLLGYFIFGVPIHGSLVFLALESILFTITALSLGIFISTKTNSQQVALMISLVLLMLPTMLLSGFIFPVENMPWVLRVISNVVPAKWFLIIIKGIMLKGSGIGMLWKETLILTGFILIFIGLSIKNYKVRLS